MPSSCHGGGNCSQTTDGEIVCDCRFNRAGKYCEYTCTFDIEKFSGRSCSRAEICVIGNDGEETCRCEDHVSGSHCMMSTDVKNECEQPNICNNRGKCLERTYGYNCRCNSYSSGKNCEILDECIRSYDNTCHEYGGRCVDLPKGYKCINCPQGQTGDKYQYKKDPCSVSCYDATMEVSCDMRFLSSKLKQIPIYLNIKNNDCKLYNYGRTATKQFSYNDCGTKMQVGKN
uniref:protein crumbs homolog 1-like n=1 Tax=Styela clava TaxID=7725 RepID=UPI00193A446E|nr:protein crumbs homolog 1-like [Styela clava]